MTTWVYESGTGRLLYKEYADGKRTSYGYASNGAVATREWARGVVTTYSYSDFGDVTGIDYTDATPDVSFAVDRNGRRTGMTDALGSSTSTSHDDGSFASQTYTGGDLAGVSIAAGKDAEGRLGSLTISGGAVSKVARPECCLVTRRAGVPQLA